MTVGRPEGGPEGGPEGVPLGVGRGPEGVAGNGGGGGKNWRFSKGPQGKALGVTLAEPEGVIGVAGGSPKKGKSLAAMEDDGRALEEGVPDANGGGGGKKPAGGRAATQLTRPARAIPVNFILVVDMDLYGSRDN